MYKKIKESETNNIIKFKNLLNQKVKEIMLEDSLKCQYCEEYATDAVETTCDCKLLFCQECS